MKSLIEPIIILLVVILIAPAYGQGAGNDVWNVYCNGDGSQCTIAKESIGELTISQFPSKVTWNTAQAWMDEWRKNNVE